MTEPSVSSPSDAMSAQLSLT